MFTTRSHPSRLRLSSAEVQAQDLLLGFKHGELAEPSYRRSQESYILKRMDDKLITINNLISSAEDNIKVANDMYKLGHYSWCLFMWHLATEKLLKALLVSEDNEVLYLHNLSKLAKGANLKLNNEQTKELDEITTFNLEVRYEDYKLAQYKKATKEYTDKWREVCERYCIWIKEKIKR